MTTGMLRGEFKVVEMIVGIVLAEIGSGRWDG